MAGGVAKDGAVRIRRVVCAVDCGTVVNPDIVRDQIQSAIIFGITAALPQRSRKESKHG
jgi:isoquinoline 1-oxidoreductase subunit beta